MPQFDLTTYSSQIFWLGICFAILYTCVSKIILPRITNIIKERSNSIDGDNAIAKDLNEKIESLEDLIKTLKKTASTNYQNKLDEASKEASFKRSKAIETLKEKIDQDTAKSRQEIKKFVETTFAQSESLTKDLEKQIKEKLFGKDLAQKLTQ